MKIGILGGSFDPAHQGHLHISKLALQKLALDQIWVIPTAQNPLKKKSAISYQARIDKCQEMFKNNPQIRVKDFEKYSFFAYDLVKKLRAQFPRAHFVWVMGDDNLRDFHKWKKVNKLVQMIDFAVFARVLQLTNFRLPLSSPSLPRLSPSFPRRRESIGWLSTLDNSIPAYSGITKKGAPMTQRDATITKKHKFQFFNTKKYDISSTAIRNHN